MERHIISQTTFTPACGRMLRALSLLTLLGVLVCSSAPAATVEPVHVQILTAGVPDNRTWPTNELTQVADTYSEPAFAFFHLPWQYTSTGVRTDRSGPLLVRATATFKLPAGKYDLLLRARSGARLNVDGRLVAELPFPKPIEDGHDAVRTNFLALGDFTRQRAPGDYETLVPFTATGKTQSFTFETLLGGKRAKDLIRVEPGETLLAVSRAGANQFHLLAPKLDAPLTDAGWANYRLAREAAYDQLESARRATTRAQHADYWAMRHAAAKSFAQQNPPPEPPAVSQPAANPLDQFVYARIERALASGKQAHGTVEFHRDVLPILEKNCLSCHSGKPKGGLMLDTLATTLKGGDSEKPALVAGHPEKSPLIERLNPANPDDVMPPKGERLTTAQIELLTRWVKEGAVWPEEQPVSNLTVTPPTTDGEFIRRVTLDTIGLFPTAAEVRAFAADQHPDKRAKLIDRLLADPRWADHWVGFWQDLLAENPNLVNATLNNTGPFRWWIYESFRDNKPMDMFITELIRMEGGVYDGGPAGFSLAALNDSPMAAKAGIISSALLATEMKCARCHDAPYHQSKQADLFHLAAMLAQQPVEVPKTSSVSLDKLAGRKSLIQVTLKPGDKLTPEWTLKNLMRDELPPGFLPAEADSRTHLAALITAPQNERFAEVLVNRVWHRYFGRGLAEPLNDWEKTKISHPDLLKWLAREFIRNDYDLKHLARLILNSQAYQRQSRTDADANRLFAAPIRRRLSAEQLVDSLFTAYGKDFDTGLLCIDVDSGRTPKLALNFGEPRRAWQFVYTSNDRDRPSLNLPRAQVITELMAAFGWEGNRQEPISVRKNEPNPLQPALLANGTASLWLTRLSEDSGLTELTLQKQPVEQLVAEVFLRILGRSPTKTEREKFIALLQPGYDQRILSRTAPLIAQAPKPYVSWGNHLEADANVLRQKEEVEAHQGPAPTVRLAADWRMRMEDFLWALLNAPETIYVP
jgi:mono/diheme cytochrome c family protein